MVPPCLIPANELSYSMCGVQCLSGDHDQVGVHSSRNVANSIHERLGCLRPSQFCIYLPMNLWIVLSESLSGDQSCVDIVQGILLRVFMRGCCGQGPYNNIVPACLFELIFIVSLL